MRRAHEIVDLQTQRSLLRLDMKSLRDRRKQHAFEWEAAHGDQVDFLIDQLFQVTRSLIAVGSN